jgi:hypothetical protein
LTTLPVQGKDSNAALPLHPHPAAVFPTSVYHGRGRYKQSALSAQSNQLAITFAPVAVKKFLLVANCLAEC